MPIGRPGNRYAPALSVLVTWFVWVDRSVAVTVAFATTAPVCVADGALDVARSGDLGVTLRGKEKYPNTEEKTNPVVDPPWLS